MLSAAICRSACNEEPASHCRHSTCWKPSTALWTSAWLAIDPICRNTCRQGKRTARSDGSDSGIERRVCMEAPGGPREMARHVPLRRATRGPHLHAASQLSYRVSNANAHPSRPVSLPHFAGYSLSQQQDKILQLAQRQSCVSIPSGVGPCKCLYPMPVADGEHDGWLGWVSQRMASAVHLPSSAVRGPSLMFFGWLHALSRPNLGTNDSVPGGAGAASLISP